MSDPPTPVKTRFLEGGFAVPSRGPSQGAEAWSRWGLPTWHGAWRSARQPFSAQPRGALGRGGAR